jgi:hypothetical protein
MPVLERLTSFTQHPHALAALDAKFPMLRSRTAKPAIGTLTIPLLPLAAGLVPPLALGGYQTWVGTTAAWKVKRLAVCQESNGHIQLDINENDVFRKIEAEIQANVKAAERRKREISSRLRSVRKNFFSPSYCDVSRDW